MMSIQRTEPTPICTRAPNLSWRLTEDPLTKLSLTLTLTPPLPSPSTSRAAVTAWPCGTVAVREGGRARTEALFSLSLVQRVLDALGSVEFGERGELRDEL